MYRFATEQQKYGDLSSGAVLHSAPGFPAFPVRLADEILLRCAAALSDAPLRLWDPLCGSGYLVSILGLRHRSRLIHVHATDIDAAAVAIAETNLALLTSYGLKARESELRDRAATFTKPSYSSAADAAVRLRKRLEESGGDLPSSSGIVDVFIPDHIRLTLPENRPNVVIADVPYGRQVEWQGKVPADPIRAFIDSVGEVVNRPGVVAIVQPKDKAQTILSDNDQLGRVRVGKRDVRFLVFQ